MSIDIDVEYTPEDLELTPEWELKAKYPSVVQILNSQNTTEQKYRLIEKIITKEK